MTIDESIKLAEDEISEVFNNKTGVFNAPSVDTGKLGEIVGKCPACGKNVVRGNYNYGCFGYKEGCTFKMGISICKKEIPIYEAKRLLCEGATGKLTGFISKSGKRFDARLIVRDKEVVFDFPERAEPEKKKKTSTKKKAPAKGKAKE